MEVVGNIETFKPPLDGQIIICKYYNHFTRATETSNLITSKPGTINFSYPPDKIYANLFNKYTDTLENQTKWFRICLFQLQVEALLHPDWIFLFEPFEHRTNKHWDHFKKYVHNFTSEVGLGRVYIVVKDKS